MRSRYRTISVFRCVYSYFSNHVLFYAFYLLLQFSEHDFIVNDAIRILINEGYYRNARVGQVS